MRAHGTLVKWNEERGFGFVATGQAGEEVFVHVSAFPRDGVRPRVGEMVSFELVPGDGGKRKAINLQRPGAAPRGARGSSAREPLLSNRQGIAASLASLLVLAGLGVLLMVLFRREEPAPALAPVAAPLGAPAASIPAVSAPAPAPASALRCDGRRHCSQMTSCAEAEFFLANCPDTLMDGDNDRIPCEEQFCR